MPDGSAIWVYHVTNAQWVGADAAENMGFGAWQGFVDFDRMGATFRIVWAGDVGSSSFPANTVKWRVRVGGTYGSQYPTPLIGVDGDIALEQVQPFVPVFGNWSVTQVVTNIWSGRQIVKVTGEPLVIGANPATLRGTLVFCPVF